jgi:hypothetical protein
MMAITNLCRALEAKVATHFSSLWTFPRQFGLMPTCCWSSKLSYLLHTILGEGQIPLVQHFQIEDFDHRLDTPSREVHPSQQEPGDP